MPFYHKIYFALTAPFRNSHSCLHTVHFIATAPTLHVMQSNEMKGNHVAHLATHVCPRVCHWQVGLVSHNHKMDTEAVADAGWFGGGGCDVDLQWTQCLTGP